MVELLQKRLANVSELEDLRQSIVQKRDPNLPCITVCAGTGCRAFGAEEVIIAFKEEIERRDLKVEVDVGLKITGCHGFCERGPLVVIRPNGVLYQRVKTEDVPEILSETVVNGNIIERLLYSDPITGEKTEYENEVPFYKRQRRIVFGSNGEIDPNSIDDYIAIGGYSALPKALSCLRS